MKGKQFVSGSAGCKVVGVTLYDSGLLHITDANDNTLSASKDELKIADKIGSVSREIVLP